MVIIVHFPRMVRAVGYGCLSGCAHFGHEETPVLSEVRGRMSEEGESVIAKHVLIDGESDV